GRPAVKRPYQSAPQKGAPHPRPVSAPAKLPFDDGFFPQHRIQTAKEPQRRSGCATRSADYGPWARDGVVGVMVAGSTDQVIPIDDREVLDQRLTDIGLVEVGFYGAIAADPLRRRL